jgi:hypothetical protein
VGPKVGKTSGRKGIGLVALSMTTPVEQRKVMKMSEVTQMDIQSKLTTLSLSKTK